MPGTDRDRALALGVMMGLRRERDWYFTMSVPHAIVWSILTFGVGPVLALSKRFERYIALEWNLLNGFVDALAVQVAAEDVAPLRAMVEASPRIPYKARWPLHLLAGVAMLSACGVITVLAYGVLRDAQPDAPHRVQLLFGPLVGLGLAWGVSVLLLSFRAWRRVHSHAGAIQQFVHSFNQLARLYDLREIDAGARMSTVAGPVGFASVVERYVADTDYTWRCELAQRLAELRWTPIEQGADGAVRVE
ncbi:MAG: hypothetical protein QM770_15470 [Tepidisphaeraceae bacterium]